MGTRRDGAAVVGTTWLEERAGHPGVTVIEVGATTAPYRSGHIPHALALDVERDLRPLGRRDIIDRDACEGLLGALGVHADTTLVLYGERNNWFAAWALWILRLYGHRDVRLLDGGRQRWEDEGRSFVRRVPTRHPVAYRSRTDSHPSRVLRDEMIAAVATGDALLVDVRTAQEFAGDLVAMPGDAQQGVVVPGHLPGAVWAPWAEAVDDAGSFRPVAEVRDLYAARGIDGTRPVIVYCTTGERAAHSWFVLHELLGLDDVRLYDGGWVEWGNLVGVDASRGSDPLDAVGVRGG